MKFSDAINEIRNRVNIVDVIGRSVRLKRAGANYMGLCPFHNEKTPSFVVSENKQIFKCFGCGKGGNVYTFLQEHEGLTFPEAVRMLAKQVNVTIDDDLKFNNEIIKKKEALYKLYKDVANEYYKVLYSEEGRFGLEYLLKRNLSNETIKKFGLGFAPKAYGYMYKIMKEKGYSDTLLFESKLFSIGDNGPHDFFYDRVMFPLVDTFGNVVSFQGRILIKDAKNKYINNAESIIYKKSKHLFAINFAKNTNKDYYILCEGNMDAITLHQAGFDNAIASWGTAFNIEQARLIKRKVRKVYLCQDTDSAGIKAIEASSKICEEIGIDTYVIDLSPVKDADEFINKYGSDAFTKKLEKPISTFLFLISTLKKQYNLENSYDYQKYIETIITRLSEFDNQMIREKYIKDVAIQEKLSYEELIRQVDKYLQNNKADIYISDNKTTNVYNKIPDIVKICNSFLSILVSCPELRDNIKNVISIDELPSESLKYVYKKYIVGMNTNEILDLSNELNDEEKKEVHDILFDTVLDEKLTINEIKATINELIKKIKKYNLQKNSNNDLKSILENNQKMIEIDKSIYVL